MNDLSPWEHVINTQMVVALHQKAIDDHGGLHSPPKEGCLEQSLGNAYTAEQYTQTSDSAEGLGFAGYLLFYLSRNHCFTDGNKRIAWIAAMRVLLNHGLTVEASDDEAEEFCMRIADGNHPNTIKEAEGVVFWLAERLIYLG